MEYSNLDDLQNLYDSEFRCIRYETNQNDDLVLYLKNFSEEESRELTVSNKAEVEKIKTFIDNY